MRLFDWRWLAATSLLLAAASGAQTRPQYGGTARVFMRASLASLDPADGSQADSIARRSLSLLMFDTLITTDASGRAQPSLASSWQASQGNQHWQFRLRHGIKFHDGSPLSAEAVAASLRAPNPAWKLTATEDSVVIELDSPDPEMLAELALPRNAIAKRNADNTLSGTGPFQMVNWQPGTRLTLTANENCWRGRAFLDGIEIEMGRGFRDQMIAVEAGKADLAEMAPGQVGASLDGFRFVSSAPVELVALLFAREAATDEEKLLREALAMSVERGSIRSVLLQGAGLPAGSILPNWMSGYGFVFSINADLPRANHAREQVRSIPTWTIGYGNGDPMERLLAERIALNAKDAGLRLQPTSAATADLRVVRIPLASADPWIALAVFAASYRLPAARSRGGAAEDLYAAEQSMLATYRVIPLFHLPAAYVAAPALKNWKLRPDGSWSLEDAWLESGKQ